MALGFGFGGDRESTPNFDALFPSHTSTFSDILPLVKEAARLDVNIAIQILISVDSEISSSETVAVKGDGIGLLLPTKVVADKYTGRVTDLDKRFRANRISCSQRSLREYLNRVK